MEISQFFKSYGSLGFQIKETNMMNISQTQQKKWHHQKVLLVLCFLMLQYYKEESHCLKVPCAPLFISLSLSSSPWQPQVFLLSLQFSFLQVVLWLDSSRIMALQICTFHLAICIQDFSMSYYGLISHFFFSLNIISHVWMYQSVFINPPIEGYLGASKF